MVFADASVLVAILLKEEDGPEQMARLVDHLGDVQVSPIVRYEVVTSLAVANAKRTGRPRIARADVEEASRLLDDLLAEVDGREVDITPEVGRLALDALARYGKLSGHPARLNMGDCLAYACARSLGAALLYKGDDFARTDLA